MEKTNTKETSDAISDHNSLSRSIGNNYELENNTDEEDSLGICNHQTKPKRIKSPSRTQRKRQQSAAKRRSKARL